MPDWHLLSFALIGLPAIVIPAAYVLIDFINAQRARQKKHKALPQENSLKNLVSIDSMFVGQDFTILIPIFGHIRYLKNVDFLSQYGQQVVLCTTTKESPDFYNDLEQIAKEHKFRIFKSEVPISSPTQKPNPWKLFHLTLKHKKVGAVKSETVRDEIMRDSFSVIKTPYCIFLDGDTVSKEHFSRLVTVFAAKTYDIASVRVLVSKEDSIMEKLQGVEYKMAMDARRLYPWLTSGACMIAKSEVIRQIMLNHSLFFSGGDIEIGKLARMMKFKVGHIPFELYTDVPSTFWAWFKQRQAWCGGGFRHTIVNCTTYIWRHPFYFLYFTIIVYAATPLRWYEVIKHPYILPLVIAFYWILTYALNWKTRRWYYLLFPFYALVQVMFIVPLGMWTYFKMAFSGRNIGIIRLRHRKNKPLPEPQLQWEPAQATESYADQTF